MKMIAVDSEDHIDEYYKHLFEGVKTPANISINEEREKERAAAVAVAVAVPVAAAAARATAVVAVAGAAAAAAAKGATATPDNDTSRDDGMATVGSTLDIYTAVPNYSSEYDIRSQQSKNLKDPELDFGPSTTLGKDLMKWVESRINGLRIFRFLINRENHQELRMFKSVKEKTSIEESYTGTNGSGFVATKSSTLSKEACCHLHNADKQYS
ncbi:hypothetical protein ACLOJK_001055 [Asimina triloba]